MKGNKGFSLVEFLVGMAVLAIVMTQVITLMANCSTLFRNGSAEVKLQSEAQRASQIIEELLIDIEKAGSVNTSSTSELSFTKGGQTYRIYLVPHADEGHGDLMLASGSTDQILAENCDSLNFDYSHYIESGRITMNIVMASDVGNGHTYTYGSAGNAITKDFFLRNKPDSPDTTPSVNNVDSDEEVEVLRFGYVDLNETFLKKERELGLNSGAHFAYEFENGTAYSTNNFYRIVGSKVESTDAINHKFNKKEGETQENIIAKYPAGHANAGDEAFKIRVFSVPVEVAMSDDSGNDTERQGRGVFYAYSGTADTPSETALTIKGIKVSREAIGLTNSFGDATGSSVVKIGLCDGSAGGSPEDYSTWVDLTDTTLGSSSGKDVDFKHSSDSNLQDSSAGAFNVQNVRVYLNEETNSIGIHTSHMQASNAGMETRLVNWFNANKNNKAMVYVELNYSGAKISTYAYCAPAGRNETDSTVPFKVDDTFWSTWD